MEEQNELKLSDFALLILYFFIMDKIIQKSLKSEILLTLNEINRDNNELLIWLQKINDGQLQHSSQLSEKL